tara:strand:- start:65 stop:1138 length:1074 start_codon:yes stop_codon:yes gene_type:complete
MAEITFRDLAHAREVLATQTGANFNPSIANAAQTAIMDFQQDVSPLSPINSFQNLFGMGKTYTIDAPFEETVVIDSTGERILPAVNMNNFAKTKGRDNYLSKIDPSSRLNEEATETIQNIGKDPYDLTQYYEENTNPNYAGISNIDYNPQDVGLLSSTGPINFSNTLEGVPGSVSDPEVNLNVADLTEGAILGGPTASSFGLSNNPNATDGQRVGGVLGTIGSLAAGATIPGSSIIGLLGGMFNAMGAYQDPSEVTGNIISQGGLLSGDISGPGGSFTQTGGLNNYNFFDDLASTNPNQAVTYNGMVTNAAGARNLSGLDNYYGEGSTSDATSEGDATGGWGSYSSDMDADSYGGYY